MKTVRIRQIEKMVRALQADGYPVVPDINPVRHRLMIIIQLKDEAEEKEIMTQWNDLRRLGG